MRRELSRLRAALGTAAVPDDPVLRAIREDPAQILALGGLPPDSWQEATLRSRDDRVLMLCSRQCGKSLTAAALGLRTALLVPGSLTLILSPTLRQSGELFRQKLLRLWRKLGSPLAARPPTALALELANGSRIVSLPENEEGVRGYSGVGMLILDEAARVSDELYFAVRPFLATSGGALVALSTPFGQRGWFYEAWHSPESWLRVEVKARDCPRIPAAFLAAERKALGARFYSMEYENNFLGIVGAVFDPEDVDAAVRGDVEAVVLG
jgi:hypothetical protein